MNPVMVSKSNIPTRVELLSPSNRMMVSYCTFFTVWDNIWAGYDPFAIDKFSCLLASAVMVPILPPFTEFVNFMFVVCMLH